MAKENLKEIFKDGSVNMNLYRVNIHEYLVTTMDFLLPGEFNTTMIPYLE